MTVPIPRCAPRCRSPSGDRVGAARTPSNSSPRSASWGCGGGRHCVCSACRQLAIHERKRRRPSTGRLAAGKPAPPCRRAPTPFNGLLRKQSLRTNAQPNDHVGNFPVPPVSFVHFQIESVRFEFRPSMLWGLRYEQCTYVDCPAHIPRHHGAAWAKAAGAPSGTSLERGLKRCREDGRWSGRIHDRPAPGPARLFGQRNL